MKNRESTKAKRKKARAASRTAIRQPLSYEMGPDEKRVLCKDGTEMLVKTRPTDEKKRAKGITAEGTAIIHGEHYPVQVRRGEDFVQIVIGTKICDFHVPREEELDEQPDGFGGLTVRQLQDMGIGIVTESHLDLEKYVS